MGFAVVADEVRNLAQRCAQAARDTSALIEESIAKSTAGKSRVDHVAEAIRAVTEESGKVKTLVDEVHFSSQEQTRGIEQVANAITQMNQVAQNTAASSEESAAAAEELTAQSETLKDIVKQLTAMVGGGAERVVTHRVRAGSALAKSTPAHRTQTRSGLPALSAAVSHRPNPQFGGSGPAGIKTNDELFPMEEELKTF